MADRERTLARGCLRRPAGHAAHSQRGTSKPVSQVSRRATPAEVARDPSLDFDGDKKPVLDQTLTAAEPAGIAIGDLVLHAGDCLKAVRILNKSTIHSGTKKASDPAFNLAARLLAAKLNVVAGAGTCPVAVTALNSAQVLLDAINFNGISHATMTTTQKNQANSLATTLDRYNSNLLC